MVTCHFICMDNLENFTVRVLVGQRSVGINSRREIVGMFSKTEKCGGNIYKPFQQMFNEKKGLGRLIQFNDFLVF